MHKLFLEALRKRETEIIQYLAILAPALGGFLWLLYTADTYNGNVFTAATIGVQLLLLLGAYYSLALGYSYRSLTIEIAKIEVKTCIKDMVLKGWPRSTNDFLDRYKLPIDIPWCTSKEGKGTPWCTPPEVIKVFWIAFFSGNIFILATIWFFMPLELRIGLEFVNKIIITAVGLSCVFLSLVYLPCMFGKKLYNLIIQELDDWKKEQG